MPRARSERQGKLPAAARRPSGHSPDERRDGSARVPRETRDAPGEGPRGRDAGRDARRERPMQSAAHGRDRNSGHGRPGHDAGGQGRPGHDAGGHGRRFRGFTAEEAAPGAWELDPAQLPSDGFTAQLAPRGFLAPLLEDLGDRVITVYGRLALVRGDYCSPWAQVTWLAPRWMKAASIGDAARQLRAAQRNWRAYSPVESGLHRRSALIEDTLPHITRRPLAFGEPAPTAPMGAFTLWTPTLMLASPATTSPFPDGEVTFEENKVDPPGRAYLKLWEAFTILGKSPTPGELCLDLGAAPGSWSWVLAGLGARVFSLDRAPLAGHVAALANVSHCLGSGFGLEPQVAGQVDWLFSDMICYPAKLLGLVEKWLEADATRHALCTIKFQAETDHETARRFAAIPGSRLMHLSCNRHELTWYWERSRN